MVVQVSTHTEAASDRLAKHGQSIGQCRILSHARRWRAHNLIQKLSYRLPCDNPVHDFLLLRAASAQVYTCRFNTLVSHQIDKERNVIELLQEILGEAMTEGMWIYHFLVKPIFYGIILQLLCYASGCDTLSETVQEQVASRSFRAFKPFCRFYS